MSKPRPRRSIGWENWFGSDGESRNCEMCGAKFVPLVDGQDWCNDCMTGKGRMMELGIVFKTAPRRLAWRNDWPDWPKIKHYACTLFNHPMFNAATWDRLEIWLTAEHCQSPFEALMMKPADVVTLLRAALPATANDAGTRDSGSALPAGQPADDLLTVEQLANLARVSVSRFHSALSDGRKPVSTARPPEPIKRKRHYYSYGAMRPWLLSTWPNCPSFFPEPFAQVKSILEGDAPVA